MIRTSSARAPHWHALGAGARPLRVGAASAFRGIDRYRRPCLLRLPLETSMTPDRSGLRAQLAEAGYALLPAASARATLQLDLAALDALRDSWERLPRDAYLRDGGNYRARRHGCFVQTPAAGLLEAVPHRPHWQPTSYNALHGGLTRWFEPVEPAVMSA